jgi:hypothetical protein
MTNEEKKIYQYVLDRDVVTLSAVVKKFCLPEEQVLQILEKLSRKRFIKSDLITNINNRVRVKLYKSPITDELNRTDNVSFN